MIQDFRKFFKSMNPFKMTSFDDRMKQPVAALSPYILEERQMHVTQMDVFSRLMAERIIMFADEVNSDTAAVLVAQLQYLSAAGEGDITMLINSPGGEVTSGYGVISTMDYVGCDIKTQNIGMAASMGAMILMCGTKGKRGALNLTRTMIHQPLGGARGQASDIEIEAREIMRMKCELYNIIHERTGQSLERITLDADRNYWMTPEEALEYGIIDEVLTKKS